MRTHHRLGLLLAATASILTMGSGLIAAPAFADSTGPIITRNPRTVAAQPGDDVTFDAAGEAELAQDFSAYDPTGLTLADLQSGIQPLSTSGSIGSITVADGVYSAPASVPTPSGAETLAYRPIGPCPGRAAPGRLLDYWISGRPVTGVNQQGTRVGLFCGTYYWGLRHIWYGKPGGSGGHGSEWTYFATQVGADPTEFTRWALEQTYKNPARVVYQRNDTYLYTAPIQIKDRKGKVIKQYTVYTMYGNKTKNVITAWFTN